MRNVWSKLTVALALAALPLAGCSDTTIATPKTSGTVSIQLTDAPGDIQAAVVTISDIYLQRSAVQDSAAIDSMGAQVDLLSAPVTTNLLTLSDSVVDLVQNATVPSGVYSQLRFVIQGAYIVVDNGNGMSVYATPGYSVPDSLQVTGKLKCPSCAQSGLKVTMPGALTVNGDQNIVLVDFNVADSFGHQAGRSGMWIMHPSLKGTITTAPPPPPTGSVLASFVLADSVTLPTVDSQQVTLADFNAVLSAAVDSGASADTMALTGPDSSGVFTATFSGVAPGAYLLNLVAPDSVTVTTDPALPDSVTVNANEQATVSATVTSAAKTSG
ncbi:MAG: DUF4382 domain-containing protein [Gemmatimonadota bacterium]